MQLNGVNEIRDWLQELVRPDGLMFDRDGVMRGGVNARTLAPFTREFCATQTQAKPPEPWGVDYVAGITYEDTWLCTGEYLDYLAARHAVTGEGHLVEEMRRVAALFCEFYRECSPREKDADPMKEWDAKAGFLRRPWAGRYGKWPVPEMPCGCDQMTHLIYGLFRALPHLAQDLCDEVNAGIVGTLDFYRRRNWVFDHRLSMICSIEVAPLALNYYIPGLVWAWRVTGDTKYLRAFQRLHDDYLYNPDYYLSNWEMPYIPTRQAPADKFIWLHEALHWGFMIPWLADNAPNRTYYEWVFEEFADWNTRLLRNCLPAGFGHDYDNMAPTTLGYPETEWPENRLADPGEKSIEGYDAYCTVSIGRSMPLRKCRDLTCFAERRPDRIDLMAVAAILPLCTTPDHFTHFYDPDDRILPTHMRHRSYCLHGSQVCSWLAAYWRLRKLGKTR